MFDELRYLIERFFGILEANVTNVIRWLIWLHVLRTEHRKHSKESFGLWPYRF